MTYKSWLSLLICSGWLYLEGACANNRHDLRLTTKFTMCIFLTSAHCNKYIHAWKQLDIVLLECTTQYMHVQVMTYSHHSLVQNAMPPRRSPLGQHPGLSCSHTEWWRYFGWPAFLHLLASWWEHCRFPDCADDNKTLRDQITLIRKTNKWNGSMVGTDVPLPCDVIY